MTISNLRVSCPGKCLPGDTSNYINYITTPSSTYRRMAIGIYGTPTEEFCVKYQVLKQIQSTNKLFPSEANRELKGKKLEQVIDRINRILDTQSVGEFNSTDLVQAQSVLDSQTQRPLDYRKVSSTFSVESLREFISYIDYIDYQANGVPRIVYKLNSDGQFFPEFIAIFGSEDRNERFSIFEEYVRHHLITEDGFSKQDEYNTIFDNDPGAFLDRPPPNAVFMFNPCGCIAEILETNEVSDSPLDLISQNVGELHKFFVDSGDIGDLSNLKQAKSEVFKNLTLFQPENNPIDLDPGEFVTDVGNIWGDDLDEGETSSAKSIEDERIREIECFSERYGLNNLSSDDFKEIELDAIDFAIDKIDPEKFLYNGSIFEDVKTTVMNIEESNGTVTEWVQSILGANRDTNITTGKSSKDLGQLNTPMSQAKRTVGDVSAKQPELDDIERDVRELIQDLFVFSASSGNTDFINSVKIFALGLAELTGVERSDITDVQSDILNHPIAKELGRINALSSNMEAILVDNLSIDNIIDINGSIDGMAAQVEGIFLELLIEQNGNPSTTYGQLREYTNLAGIKEFIKFIVDLEANG